MPPTRSEEPTTEMATSKETRAPKRVRERTSRPSSSVPNQCACEGGSRRCVRSSWAGSRGASRGAKMAHNVKNTSSATPVATIGLVRSVRRTEANALGCAQRLSVCLVVSGGAVTVDVMRVTSSHGAGRYVRCGERDKIERNVEHAEIADAECEWI